MARWSSVAWTTFHRLIVLTCGSSQCYGHLAARIAVSGSSVGLADFGTCLGAGIHGLTGGYGASTLLLMRTDDVGQTAKWVIAPTRADLLQSMYEMSGSFGALSLGFGLLVTGAFFSVLSRQWVGAAILSVVAVAGLVTWRVAVARELRRLPERRVELSMAESGLTAVYSGVEVRVPWASFSGIRSTANGWYLIGPGSVLITVFRRALEPEMATEIEASLRRYLPEHMPRDEA